MSESRPTYRPSHILRCRRCLEEMEGTSHDAGRYHHCAGEIEVARKIKNERPTYRIPAREVVPGMEFSWDDDGHEASFRRVTTVKLTNGWIHLEHDTGGSGRRPEDVVLVQLPGPSPRELACTCWDDAIGHDAEYRWEDEAIRQHGERCAEYAQRRAELACARPSEHSPDCPVATVPGRHGGMRLWPAPWRGAEWTWDARWHVYQCDGLPAVTPSDLPTIAPMAAATCGHNGLNALDEVILQCFYRPPEPQPERRETPAWDPYGTDLDLAVRYG